MVMWDIEGNNNTSSDDVLTSSLSPHLMKTVIFKSKVIEMLFISECEIPC